MKYDITFHPKWWHKNAGISFKQAFFDDPEYRMACDVKMRRVLYEKFGAYGIGEENPQPRPLLGTDLLAAGYLHAQLMGCDIIYSEDNSPQVVCKNLDADHIAEIKAPNLQENKAWQVVEGQIKYLTEKFGRVEPYINLMGIQNVAMDLMGQEVFVAYYDEPELLEGLLEEITTLTIAVGKRFKELSVDVSGGVTAIARQVARECYVTSNCSIEMVSNDLYEEFLLKHDQRLSDAFGSFGVHHCGKTMEHVAKGYSKIKGLTFGEVGAFSNIKEVRTALPNIFLNARYSPARLLEATEDEVKKEVLDLIENGKNNNGTGISVSCVGIDHNVSDEKIIAFLKVCKNSQ